MVKKLTTNNFRINQIESITDSLGNTVNSFYIFVGRHVPEANSANVPDIFERPKDVAIDAYKNMIMGKKLTSSDIVPCIRNIPYVSNTAYDMYDDSDESLYTKNFYAIVDESSYFHVYKCLDNNGNVASTVTPDFSHVAGANSIVYQTSDGYRWKYMYSVPAYLEEKFSTASYFPFYANTTVQSSAVDGAIDVILIEGEGRGYDNYLSGTFSASQIRVTGDPILYAISNTNISHVNGFYTGCLIYLSSGTGSGQYATVENYYSNGSGNYIEIDTEFEIPPVNGTEYQLFPKVTIFGDGSQTTNAIARALVNSTASNSIYRIELLERGVEYDFATASVVANSVVGVESVADLRVIVSPPGGHGKDPLAELGAKVVCFAVELSNSESNTILTDNQYQQIGLLKNPVFANATFNVNSVSGAFVNDEHVYKLDPVRIVINATSVSSNSRLSSNTADFENQVAPGDYLYIASSNSVNHQLIIVNDVINSTTINATANINFSCTDVIVHQANLSSHFYTTSVANATHIICANIVGSIAIGDIILGSNSGARAVVNSISRNAVTKGFDTFVQLYKYVGAVVFGTFLENEVVYQGTSLANSTANAALHSVIVDGGTATIYTSNQTGSFVVTENIYGNLSAASATLSNKYSPELVFGSGDILFLENREAIERAAEQTETIRIYTTF